MKTSGAFVGRWFYYDRLGRVIQVVERNVHGSLSRYSMKYDFMGRLVLSEECHSWSDRWEKSDTKRTAYTYDAHGRLLAETVVLNGLEGSVSYGYDDLGRLASKTVGSGGTHVTTHYAYDIRGRLTGLEAPGLYSQEMTYSSGGNIGRIVTGSQVFGREGVVHTYGYDGHNRLCQATRVQQNDRVTYTMNYDGNGNILAHQRTASPNSAEIRRYTYSGNRLASMTRSVSGTSGTSDNYVFGYDLNGNLTFNPERPMQFRYNYLNLTDSIVWPEGGCRYSWLSDGSRASAAGFGSEGGKGRDYLGSLIYDYNQSQLELSTEFSGGRLVSGPSGDSVLLYVQDHLGSVRVVLADGRPAAYNEYAPFGESETAYSTDVFQGQRLAPQYNRFRYNGKEEFPQPGSDLLDYGARLYDPVLCRWNAIDPLAEKYCSLSGYAYCGNNPVIFVDPNGQEIRIRWVLSIPFFISCIRQQNPLTVLSKIILRKVKQFNLPPKKMRDFCIFEDTPRLFLLGNRQFTFIAHNLDVAEDVVGQMCHRHIRLCPYNPYCPDNKAVHTLLFKTEYVLDKATGLGLAPVLSLLFFCQRMIPTAFLADYRIHAMLLHG